MIGALFGTLCFDALRAYVPDPAAVTARTIG